MPLVIAPLFFLFPVACLLIAASLPGLGATQIPFVPVWGLMAMAAGFFALKNLARFRAEARDWTPLRAQNWRAMAMASRSSHASVRSLLLIMLVIEGLLMGTGTAIAQAVLMPLILNVAAYGSLTATAAFLLYARCALPCDPDLHAHVPMPA